MQCASRRVWVYMYTSSSGVSGSKPSFIVASLRLLDLCECAGTTRLEQFDLGHGHGRALEACGQLGAVEV